MINKDNGDQRPTDIENLKEDNEPLIPRVDRHLTQSIKINYSNNVDNKEWEVIESNIIHENKDTILKPSLHKSK